ncbi:hypothetical protein BDW02DRAFT_603560, partial [Decorospora gaudefroyi]
MSNRVEPPQSAVQVDPSSPLSDPPSIVLPPTTDDDSSSLSSIPDTPSRAHREADEDSASRAVDDDESLSSDDFDPDPLRPDGPARVPLSREDKLNAL